MRTEDKSTAVGDDFRMHQQTWEGFVRLMKYSTAGVAVVLILMAIFLL